jgi:hypothetical protein
MRWRVLHAADRYAYTGCGSTACSLFYLGSELILIDIRNPVGRVPVLYGIAGPYQLRCTSLRIATETRPVRNKGHLCWPSYGREEMRRGTLSCPRHIYKH